MGHRFCGGAPAPGPFFRLARGQPLPAHSLMPHHRLGNALRRSRLMPLERIAAATLLLLALAGGGTARACDSYADDMALASVLARAVAEARAQGALTGAEAAPVSAARWAGAPEASAAEAMAGDVPGPRFVFSSFPWRYGAALSRPR